MIAKLHNGSKYWLIVDNARMIEGEPEDWVKQTDAGEMTIAPGQNYYANFALQVPADAPPTRPYWHRDNPETEALNTIDEEKYQTLPLPPPPLRVVCGTRRSSETEAIRHVPDMIRDAHPRKAVRRTRFLPRCWCRLWTTTARRTRPVWRSRPYSR